MSDTAGERCPICGGPVRYTRIYVGTADDSRFADWPTVPGMAYCADPDCPPGSVEGSNP